MWEIYFDEESQVEQIRRMSPRDFLLQHPASLHVYSNLFWDIGEARAALKRRHESRAMQLEDGAKVMLFQAEKLRRNLEEK